MKDFFKMTLASAVGFTIATVVFTTISLVFTFLVLNSTFNSIDSAEKYAPQKNTVLHLKMEGSIVDRSIQSNPISEITGLNDRVSMGLNDIVTAIRKAKKNDNIKGIYIDSRIFSASTATIEEIRHEIEKFKESGKFVVAYADTYTQSGYLLASVADKVAINPQGALDIHGLASTPIFFKDALKKLGIEMQIFKVGTYKSAVEPFIQTEMSQANKEQVGSYINDTWSFIKKDIAKSRNIEPEKIDSIADLFPMIKKSDFLLSHNLVDTLLYETNMKSYLRELLNLSKDEKIPSATVANMATMKTQNIAKSSNTIALLYAEGDIISGSGANNIQDKYLVNQIEKLRKDENVKAVVFRINSGGGSAYASEQIWRAITDLKAEKPVVVSMGSMAASGGYYIACNASKIVAQPTTLTGSIGIFGMFPNLKGTFEKIGVSTDVVKTNKFSDFGNQSRPFTNDETAIMQEYINNGYDLFVSRCAEGRNMPKDTLKKYAEGRVWTGNQAKKIGLVDELGGLDKAIEIAADMASLGKSFVVYEYPKQKTSMIDIILNKDKDELAARIIKKYFGETFNSLLYLKDIKEQDYMQARMPYDLNIK